MEDSTIAALTGLAQSIGNIAAQTVASQEDKDAQRRSFEHNMKMAEYQNSVNLQNWNRQNEYNTPVQQMERLKAAGLNPNLVYNGGSAQTAATTPHAMPGATMQAYQGHWRIADAVSGALDGALKAMQLKKQAQEVKNLETHQRVTSFDADLRELQVIGQRYANAKTQAEAEIWRDMYEQRLMNMKAEGFLTDEKRFASEQNRWFQSEYQTRESNARIRNLDSSTSQNIANIGLMEYRKQLMSAQASEALSRIGVNNATAQKIVQDIQNLNADLKIKGEVLTDKELDNSFKKILYKHGVDLKDGSSGSILKYLIHSIYTTSSKSFDPYDGDF